MATSLINPTTTEGPDLPEVSVYSHSPLSYR
jgi:hypothetical protein